MQKGFLHFFLVFLSLVSTLDTVKAQNQAIPYDLKSSEEEFFKGGDRKYAQEIIGTNSESIFILFSEKFTSYYMSKPELIIRKYDKKSFAFQKELNLKQMLESIGFKYLFSIDMLNEDILVIPATGSYSELTFQGMLFNSDLELVKTNDKLLVTNLWKNFVTVRVNNDGQEVLLIEYPETDLNEGYIGKYLTFDRSLNRISNGELDLTFLLDNQRSISKLNIKTFFEDAEFSKNGELLNVIKKKDRVQVFENKPVEVEFFMYILDLETGRSSFENLDIEEDKSITGVNIFLEDDLVTLSGFFTEKTKEGTIYTKEKSQITGTFLGKYSLLDQSWKSRKTIEFDEKYLNQIKGESPSVSGGQSITKDVNGENNEGISRNYKIVDIHYNKEGNEAYVACEYQNDYSVTTTSESTGNLTTYTAIRGSGFVFSFSLISGEINWMRDVKKYSKYSSGNSDILNTVAFKSFLINNNLKVLYTTQYRYPNGESKGYYANPSKLASPFYTLEVDVEEVTTKEFTPILTDKIQYFGKSFDLEKIYFDQDSQELYSFNTFMIKRPVRRILMTLGYISFVGTIPTFVYHIVTRTRSSNQKFTLSKVGFEQ